jgi:hypothetical protein
VNDNQKQLKNLDMNNVLINTDLSNIDQVIEENKGMNANDLHHLFLEQIGSIAEASTYPTTNMIDLQ